LLDDKDEGGDNLIRAGSFAATLIDVCGALAQKESVFDVFDSYGETLAYYVRPAHAGTRIR
jgi:hypothetical protein